MYKYIYIYDFVGNLQTNVFVTRATHSCSKALHSKALGVPKHLLFVALEPNSYSKSTPK